MPMASPHVSLLMLLFCCFFFFTLEISLCRHLSGKRPPSRVHAGPAEKLIKALNLMPSEMKVPSKAPLSSHEAFLLRGSLQEKEIKLKLLRRKANAAEYEEEAASTEELGLHAGYFNLNRTYSAKMFYFFFESRGNKSEDPLMLWTTGGPGCGSELALFYENGPFHISNSTLLWNDCGWDQISNIIFVDQPIGTGFSYTSDYRDIRHDEIGVSQDLYDFVQAFLDYHSDYRSNDFFVSGESYAGHYIPALASRIQDSNAQGQASYINLKGIAIGNGLTQPDIQYEAYADYALQMGLIGDTAYARIKKRYAVCESSLSVCESEGGGVACAAAYLACNRIFDSVISLLGNTNYYDIRKECTGSMCYDFSEVTTFLNDADVQETLGISEGYEWVACSSSVYDSMLLDWMRNAEKGIPSLLNDSIRVLVYAGEYDLVCNWLGNFRWVSAMNWTGQELFAEKNFTSFSVDEEEVASVKSYGLLSFMKMHNAGHMVPMDQPKAALEMMRRWTRGWSLEDGGGDNTWPRSHVNKLDLEAEEDERAMLTS